MIYKKLLGITGVVLLASTMTLGASEESKEKEKQLKLLLH